MNSKFFCFIMIMVHILSATCRPLTPNGDVFTTIPLHQGTPANSPVLYQSTMDVEQGIRVVENRVGSNPPSCEHKCYGCSPCNATQVPTINGDVGVAIQDSNYEPEGWKCKCGRTFYSP